MATLYSYELNGKKQSFANWISNLSPTETPFSSMTPKEAINQTKYFWQTDRLAPVKLHSVKEGADVVEADISMSTTNVQENLTQILRRAFRISDTADKMANFGRGRELPYQMEKFSQAIKRDLEHSLLNNGIKVEATADAGASFAGFSALVAPMVGTGGVPAAGSIDPDTGAVVHFKSALNGATNPVRYGFNHDDVRFMTYNLYLANSEADVIMFHPMHAKFFAGLQSKGSNAKMFDGDTTTFSHYVNVYIDEFGREYKLIPNRWMPKHQIFFFKPTDFTQMILRAPRKVELGKEGNFTSWMIEMEVGLRLRDPFAAGVIELKKDA
ncbi:MAG: SU10 major capsid protein [Fusobacteriaceae bacterium]